MAVDGFIMTEKTELKNTNWVIKTGIVGGWVIIGVSAFYFLAGLFTSLFA